MSGDVQPRKRKDKKKKKETSEEIPVQPAAAQISSDDVNIHVHKERTTGGEFCAKFIFFIVMAVIAVVIGLAIVEYRGQTDLDALSTESRFAPLFEGWIDKSQGEHGHEDEEDDVPIEHSEEIEHEEDKPDEELEDVEGSEEEEATSQPESDDDDDGNKDENVESEEAEEHQDEDVDEDEDEINQADASEEDNQSEEADDEGKEEHDEVDEEEEEDQNSIFDDLTQTGDAAVYIVTVVAGFGAGLLVVITLLVRKWNSDKEQVEYLNREALRDLYRRNTLVPPPKIEVTEADEANEPSGLEKTEESDEDSEDEEEEEQEETKPSGIVRPPTPGVFPSDKKDEDGDEGDDEEADSNEEKGDSDEELMKKLEAKYGRLPSRQANDSEEEEEEVDDDEEDDKEKCDDIEDDEDKSWKRVKVLPDDDGADSESDEDKASTRRRSGAQSFYTFANITNEGDYFIRDDLDDADKHQEDNVPLALSLYTKILEKHPDSPRALYGKAQALDVLADKKRSNEILQDSVKFYSQVLKENNVPDPLFIAAAERCINRMRFVGQYGRAVGVHKLLIDRFPSNIYFRNQLAVTYLTINRIPEARQNLLETLQKWPDDGFALVHHGFILKTVDNDLEKAADYLRRGIDTKESGVIDGRFYFHLGDALARLGKKDEAMKVYEEGVDINVFLSKYQRSLYNVNRLTARPWWDKDQTTYKKFHDDLELNWKIIRDEGLSVLNSRGHFKDESENLRDVGDWKQFELYARGIKHVANCNKCPVTCKIIDGLPEARTCKRGQVKFSVMHPGTHVWPHCGPTNCRLRMHLGLKIPPNAFIRVAEETRSWEEGKILIFDDSFEHEVWHNGTEFRLVLIVDVWHPELTQREQQSLSAI